MEVRQTNILKSNRTDTIEYPDDSTNSFMSASETMRSPGSENSFNASILQVERTSEVAVGGDKSTKEDSCHRSDKDNKKSEKELPDLVSFGLLTDTYDKG